MRAKNAQATDANPASTTRRAKKKVKKEAARRAWRVAPFVDHLAVAAAALIALTE
jgi:hypothetical protein